MYDLVLHKLVYLTDVWCVGAPKGHNLFFFLSLKMEPNVICKMDFLRPRHSLGNLCCIQYGVT